jgi:fructose-1,6-bisphosphatase I
MSDPKSLRHFMEEQHPQDMHLISLLMHLTMAASELSVKLASYPFGQMNDVDCGINVQGEMQGPMDVFADHRFMLHLRASGSCCAVISEEQPEVVRMNEDLGDTAGPYIVALDPLDGSSNVAVNIPVGSIFSIYTRKDKDKMLSNVDYLQRGEEQVAAGYFLYGTTTIFVYADAKGVDGFTLDSLSGEFLHTHPGIRIPASGSTYAVNDGNYHLFRRGTQNYVRFCRQQTELGDVPYSARYTGSMVADVHRLLIRGGVFLYPGTTTAPAGKLRLAYECNPMAYIVEKAGGLAITGTERILGIEIKSIHQRSPIVIGSAQMVMTAGHFINPILPSLHELHL